MEPLLKYPDAAKVLQCSESKLRKMVMKDKIPYVKIGTLVRFRPADLDLWLGAQAIGRNYRRETRNSGSY